MLLPFISRSLPHPASRLHSLCAPALHRQYCFESGRNGKPERSNKPRSPNNKPITEASADPKPATGHGRRHRASSALHSALKPARPPAPALRLPFVPLPSDHLEHLRPKLLSLDQFFSLQRPLLEIEIPLSERRSITAESSLESSEPEVPETAAEPITTGSPSDPTFKPPQASTQFSDAANEEVDDELWGTVDEFAPFLIAEPDGVDPAWPRALKHYLASTSAFVPPPVPTPQEPSEKPVIDAQKEVDRVEKRRLQDVKFLAPFGTFNAPSSEPSDDATESTISSTMAEESSFPEMSQDPRSLTLQAARFLHSGLTSFRWPGAVEWDGVREQLAAAEANFEGREQDGGSGKPGNVGPVRGGKPSEHLSHAESTVWFKLVIESGDLPTRTIMVDSEQVKEIINHIINIRSRSGVRHQDFAIHVCDADGWELERENEVMQLDSVQRKRKRKMRVHKYKKRRKARRVLRKRQGRD